MYTVTHYYKENLNEWEKYCTVTMFFYFGFFLYMVYFHIFYFFMIFLKLVLLVLFFNIEMVENLVL